MEKLLTKKEVAEMFGITIAGLDLWMKDGKIPYIKLTGGNKGMVRFRPSSLEQFIKNRTVNSRQKLSI